MRVKIGELKNNLSRYLKRVAQTGESLTILDRNRPVGKLTPWRGKTAAKKTAWEKERERILAKAARLGIKISIPERKPVPMRELNISPRTAPDGRTDVNAVIQMRREKDY
jgi:prevent-host-death family protein